MEPRASHRSHFTYQNAAPVQHPEPVVHGLWPECNSYGTSECLAPSSSSADPTIVYSCYNQEGESTSSCLSFEQHEWTTHGVCAGVSDAKDFFTQVLARKILNSLTGSSSKLSGKHELYAVAFCIGKRCKTSGCNHFLFRWSVCCQVCSISTKPLSIMASSRSSGGDLSSMANALTQAGYEVFSVDASNSQVELSACAGPNRKWVLAPVAKFSSYCGGWTNSDIQNATSADISDVDGVHNNSTA